MNIPKKYNYTLYIYIASCISLWSCSEKDIPVPDEPQNKPVLQQEEASRIEVPKQKDGSHNQFIVKKAKLREDGDTMFVNFCMEYDQQKKSTRWTAFRWDMDNIYDSKCGRYGTYLSDPDVPKQYRVDSGDFQGYSPGHMLASEDRQCSASANKQTFYMTNMHPQFEGFNGLGSKGDYVWFNAEKLVRSLYKEWNSTKNALDTLYIVKGGTIDKQEHILGYTSNNKASNIIVPKYFYIAILYRHSTPMTGDSWNAIALWIPHTEGDTTSGKDIAMKYAISIDELEERTDIDFFHNLPDDIEENVEKSYDLTDWNWIDESLRIEVPKQKEGSHNQFIVKKAKLREDQDTMFVNFCMEYDQQKKSTRWTAFRWDMDNIYDSKCGRYGTYLSDPDVPKQYRVGSGYFQGYSRGHMLASEDRQCSASANKQTFFMTNMHPQFERFNGYDSQGNYVWLNAEKLARSLYQNWNSNDNGLDTIYVVKGGTIDKQEHILGYTSNNNSSKIIVPRYFYMAILYRHANQKTGEYWKSIALWIPHTEGDTTSGKDIAMKYAMSIDELEEKTDIDFFHNLPDNIEDNVEKSYSLNDWNWK